MKKQMRILLLGLMCVLLPMWVWADDTQKDAMNLLITEQQVPAKQYLYSRHIIETVEEVNRLEWLHTRRLQKRLASLQLKQVAPIEYHLVFESPMYLDIAIPIDKLPSSPGEDSYKQTEPFKCLSMTFNGSPLDASEQWAVVQAEVTKRGFVWSKQNREIVVNREGFDAQQYVTELQVGIE